MQYGELSSEEQSQYLRSLSAVSRQLTMSVWVDGVEDISAYVTGLRCVRGIEEFGVHGLLIDGRLNIYCSNYLEYIWSEGVSIVPLYSRIKVYVGYDYCNIPVFSGVVYSVRLDVLTNTVIISCCDYMRLIDNMLINRSFSDDPSPKGILESICSEAQVPFYIESTDVLLEQYDRPYLYMQYGKDAIREVLKSIFYVGLFDEDGKFRIYKRDIVNEVDFSYTSENVLNISYLDPTDVYNRIKYEYDDGLYLVKENVSSKETYGLRTTVVESHLSNYEKVSVKSQGYTGIEVEYENEAFKITASGGMIDFIRVKMFQNGTASGYIRCYIYDDNAGVPGEEVGISQLKSSGDLWAAPSWENFYFVDNVYLSTGNVYWVVFKYGRSSGKIYVVVSGGEATGNYAYLDNETWVVVDNKTVVHLVSGSVQSDRVCSDILRYYSDPKDRLVISALGTPHLQLMDTINVDVEKPGIRGKYVIEKREYVISEKNYTFCVYDTVRRIS